MNNKGHLTLVEDLVIETDRLILRPPQRREVVGPFLKWWETDRWAKDYLNRKRSFADPAGLKQNLWVVNLRSAPWVNRPRALRGYSTLADWVAFAVFLKQNVETPIGVMVLYDFDWYHGFVQMRSFIETASRHTGFGKECTVALLQFLFEELLVGDGEPWYSAEAHWFRPNIRSAHLYTGCGFRVLEDVLEGRVRVGKRRYDMVMSQFTRPKWDAMKKILGDDFLPTAARWRLPNINRHLHIAGILKSVELRPPRRDVLGSLRYKIVKVKADE